ncbi:rhodanese-related sulfurtransferase [Aphanothece hegewaldii CCALA 016]|uniref:Rhodanese-related sulfurtransferase n=1 Tax=Aphanothece hegewaldii CCALA 016 TaxID=2107694 RepID=A0A2T1LQW1_9CHRO|nr:immunity 53 family protein [Aphanothece hegewaldii]PSF30036.1 rhodanese-related sulfurtransferase [Aphanothece hegewaldii CCALA 016]
MSILADIQKWYASNCDGEWEHGFGITINTLDNPGWSVTINLKDTNLEGKNFEPFQNEASEERWIYCSVEENKFRGAGDETKLEEILKVFLDWAFVAKRRLVETARTAH